MKRKDFLRHMRNRRRGDQIELREPEQRRAIDWRTLRVDLPAQGESQETIAPGVVTLTRDGIHLRASEACWVRGYRAFKAADGHRRAEFQYRPAEADTPPPPGAVALRAEEIWTPGQ